MKNWDVQFFSVPSEALGIVTLVARPRSDEFVVIDDDPQIPFNYVITHVRRVVVFGVASERQSKVPCRLLRWRSFPRTLIYC